MIMAGRSVVDQSRPEKVIVVQGDADRPARGTLAFDGTAVPCALGRSGVTQTKREGDGATPAGFWPMRRILYRADRIDLPATGLSATPLAPDDGWCDAPEHPAYNMAVKHPFPASAERLWREDALYDVIVVLGYNDAPATPGAGSAIFFHLARPDLAPTEGCIAVVREHMLAILGSINGGAVLVVEPPLPPAGQRR